MSEREGVSAKRPTIYDVARHAGVSHQTVSRHLRGLDKVRPETRARIDAACKELGYQANLPARNLRKGRTGTISLAVPSLNQPYFAELAQSVIAAARSSGLTVFIETTEFDRQREFEVLSRPRGNLVDGLLFAPAVVTADELSNQDVNFPLVLLGDRIVHSPFDHVTMSNEAGAYAAVSHLTARGRRRIVALGVEPPGYPGASSLRRAGYLRALGEAGISADPRLELDGKSWIKEDGVRAMQKIIDDGVPFDAVFGFNDALALGALRALLTAGYRVPDDVAVVGFDDTQDGQFTTPSLTSVSPGRDEIARRAIDLLVQQRDSGMARRGNELQVPFHLEIRESTGG